MTDAPFETDMLRVVVAHFSSKTDNRPVLEETTWGEFRGRLTHFDIRESKGGPLWSPVAYKPGTTRGNANVEAVYLAVHDVDDGTDPAYIVSKLTGTFEFIIYSTFSSTSENPKYRVVVPLDKPCPAEKWPAIWGRLCDLLTGGHTDRSTKDVARLFFWPTARPEGQKFIFSGRGRPVFPDDLPPPRTADPAVARPPAGDLKELLDRVEGQDAEGPLNRRLLETTQPEPRAHSTNLYLAWILWKAGASDAQIVQQVGWPESEVRSTRNHFETEGAYSYSLETLRREDPLIAPTEQELVRSSRASSLVGLLAETRTHFDLDDPYILEFVLSNLATIAMPGDPVWGFIVGAASGLKTEVLRWFSELPCVFTTSRLTPHSLVSGLKGGHSLLPDLDGKALVIKDFTTILEMDRKAREEIFAQLRDAFDGYYEGHFGSVGKVSFHSHFHVIAAVTSAVETYYSVQSFLGPRFLKVRAPPLDGFEHSIEDGGKEVEIRSRCSALVQRLVRSIRGNEWKSVEFSRVRELKPIVELLALGRTHISREHDYISQIPEPEMLPRLTKQLRKLAVGRAILYGRSRVEDSDLDFVRRVAWDTLPVNRATLLQALKTPGTPDVLAQEVGLPRVTVYRHLEELQALGLIAGDGARPETFSLPDTPHFYGTSKGRRTKGVGGDGVAARLNWLKALGFDESDPRVQALRRKLGGVGA